MDWQVGEILEGKVSGITKFGAFVALPGGKSGLQTVKVKLLSYTPEGKINLSIKRALDDPPRVDPRPRRQEQPSAPRAAGPVPAAAETSGNQAFEDRLKKFMQESDSRIADSRMYAEHRQRRRR